MPHASWLVALLLCEACLAVSLPCRPALQVAAAGTPARAGPIRCEWRPAGIINWVRSKSNRRRGGAGAGDAGAAASATVDAAGSDRNGAATTIRGPSCAPPASASGWAAAVPASDPAAAMRLEAAVGADAARGSGADLAAAAAAAASAAVVAKAEQDERLRLDTELAAAEQEARGVSARSAG
eukprot:scaffold32072_cov79-Isochrysis_galbana.AAC.1